jgi:Methyltransferase domain
MKRIVQPELLDVLRPEDPLATRSRRDLRRVNSLMGNPAIMARTLENNSGTRAPRQIIELGAGDGNFLLAVAQKISPRWPDVNATLLDLQKNVSSEMLAAFSKLGWRAEAVVADVFDWPQIPTEVVVANLFLHHFENARLAGLLDAISRRAKLFIAIEPRRGCLPFLFSQLLWLIGCNSVTQHDAPISVRAGFSGAELSALWPDKQNWRLTEQRVGAFSHLFIARRNN